MVDLDTMDGICGCIANEINDSEDAWTQIGANWGLSRYLLNEMKAEAGML